MSLMNCGKLFPNRKTPPLLKRGFYGAGRCGRLDIQMRIPKEPNSDGWSRHSAPVCIIQRTASTNRCGSPQVWPGSLFFHRPEVQEDHARGSLRYRAPVETGAVDAAEIPFSLVERILERVAGIEPAYSAWKAAALPLSYTREPADDPAAPRLVEGAGFEPAYA